LRIVIVVAAAAFLFGCETDDEYWPPFHDSAGNSPAQSEASSPATPPYDAHCHAVAHQRAADARANGYSIEMEETVYQGTYKDCMSWESQHAR